MTEVIPVALEILSLLSPMNAETDQTSSQTSALQQLNRQFVMKIAKIQAGAATGRAVRTIDLGPANLLPARERFRPLL